MTKIFNLEDRTAIFGENIIKFCKTINQDIITKPLISQLVRSSTSVGANYMEANATCSKKDFKNKTYFCKKEIQETKHWLRMISSSITENIKDELEKISKECQELIFIFQKITSSSRSNT